MSKLVEGLGTPVPSIATTSSHAGDARRNTKPGSGRTPPTVALTFGLALVVGFAVSWRVLFEPGVIGLVHDWSVPPFAGQNVALLHQLFDGWYRWGLGLAIAYPLEYPLRLLLGACGVLGLDGRFVSKAIVVLVPAGSFVALTWLARCCGLPQRAAWLGGAFYALDPVMLNKLVSGQLTYLLGYAVLPLVPAAFIASIGACTSRSRAWLGALALGGLLALTAVQVQLGVLASLVLLLLAVTSTRVPARRRVLVVAIAFAMLGAVELPTLAWLRHGVTGIEQLDQFGHRAAWLKANSIAPADAVRLIGYLAHYDISATFGWTTVWDVASWGMVAAAAVGLVALPAPMRGVCLTVVITTIAFVSGTSTVLGPAITWVFEHVPVAQMFRELYHAMAGVSLAYALAIGACFALAARWQYGRYAQAALLVVIGAYVAPMLSGDISGWLQAAPVDRYLAPAYADVDRGAGRVVWFPLDQPLAFDGYGAGVDPSAVTDRGSLWLYSLTWPLTAVDMAARMGDDATLRDELRALGVAVAVNRSRLTSRYDTFSAEGSVARRLFRRPLSFGPALGDSHVYAPTLASYALKGGPIVDFPASGATVVPQRLAVIAELSLAHVAPFGFTQPPPAGVPYAVSYDADDRSWEALQVAGLSRSFDAPAVNALHAFAGGDVWWWYRAPYADAERFSFAIGAARMQLATDRGLPDAIVVVAWIATPAGGRLSVTCGGVPHLLDTGGTWSAWRSAEIHCGSMAAGERVDLQTLDASAEVALRGAQIVDGADFSAAEGRFDALLHNANVVAPLGPGVTGAIRFTRSGRAETVGVVERGQPVVLAVERLGGGTNAAVTVKAPDGYVVAWRPFAAGQREVRIPLIGDGSVLRLQPSGAVVSGWRLAPLLRAPPEPAVPVTHAANPQLFVLNQTFDRGWQVDGAVEHLPTALGTNVFLTPGAAHAVARFSFSTQYHAAFAAGTVALLIAMFAGIAFLVTGVKGRRSGLMEGLRP